MPAVGALWLADRLGGPTWRSQLADLFGGSRWRGDLAVPLAGWPGWFGWGSLAVILGWASGWSPLSAFRPAALSGRAGQVPPYFRLAVGGVAGLVRVGFGGLWLADSG